MKSIHPKGERTVLKSLDSVERAQHQHKDEQHEEIVLWTSLFAAVGLFSCRKKKEKHDRILSVICSPTDTIRGPGDSCLHACTFTGIRLRPRGGLPLTTTQRWWLDLLIISTYDLLIFLPVTTLVKDLMNVEWLTCNHDLILRTLLHNSMRHKSLPSFHAISSTLLLESMSATLQLILVYGRLTRQSYQTNTTVRLMQFVPEYK